MIPDKLKKGDEIRIIAPAKSLSLLSKENIELSLAKLKELGFKVTFGKHAKEMDDFQSSSINSRIEDLHDAFNDKNVKMVLPVIGGFNSNQLLRYIDYNLIKKNPKILGGYSDITALQNAIYAKTGLVTYSTPAFSTFSMKIGNEYNLDYFKKCLISKEPFEVMPSKEWSDDSWWRDQSKREFIKNNGYLIINEGKAEGTILGANLCTFNLIQGTEFMPNLNGSILFIEDDYESKALNFDRDLQSLIHQPGFDKVRGMIIGRFQKASEVTNDLLIKIIKSKKELENIPVIANVDFGHTDQLISFPIGGRAKLEAKNGKVKILIVEH